MLLCISVLTVIVYFPPAYKNGDDCFIKFECLPKVNRCMQAVNFKGGLEAFLRPQ